jgi:hypothetical protein
MAVQAELELDPLHALLNPVHINAKRDMIAALFCIHRQGNSTLFGPTEQDVEGAFQDADKVIRYGREHPAEP